MARCRSRFVVPVILFEGKVKKISIVLRQLKNILMFLSQLCMKPIISTSVLFLQHICRSATISGGAEIYGRSGLDFLLGAEPQQQMEPAPEPTRYAKLPYTTGQ